MVQKQYIISKDDKKIKEELAIKLINISNINRYETWDERETFS